MDSDDEKTDIAAPPVAEPSSTSAEEEPSEKILWEPIPASEGEAPDAWIKEQPPTTAPFTMGAGESLKVTPEEIQQLYNKLQETIEENPIPFTHSYEIPSHLSKIHSHTIFPKLPIDFLLQDAPKKTYEKKYDHIEYEQEASFFGHSMLKKPEFEKLQYPAQPYSYPLLNSPFVAQKPQIANTYKSFKNSNNHSAETTVNAMVSTLQPAITKPQPLVVRVGDPNVPDDPALLGGKGASLHRMALAGLPVPPAVILTTEVWRRYSQSQGIRNEIEQAVAQLQDATQRTLGDPQRPLIISVRSGAPVSMPGMLETILNVGMTQQVVDAMVQRTGNWEHAYHLWGQLLERYHLALGNVSEAGMQEIKTEIPKSEFLTWALDKLRLNANDPDAPPGTLTTYAAGTSKGRKALLDQTVEQLRALRNTLNLSIDGNMLLSHILKGDQSPYRLTDLPIAVHTSEGKHARIGKIKGFSEEGLTVLWDHNQEATIPYNRIYEAGLDLGPAAVDELLKRAYEKETFGYIIPDTLRLAARLQMPTPEYQLDKSIGLVFESWNKRRAREYRRANNISDKIGTAIVIQQMVFGNTSTDSGTAVVYSSCPRTAKPGITGEFLQCAQGTDIVDGTRTPEPLERLAKIAPSVHEQITKGAALLEGQRDVIQDIEITWEGDRVYFLQTRDAKLTPRGRTAHAIRRLKDGRIDKAQLLRSLDDEMIAALNPTTGVDEALAGAPVARGIPVVEGTVVGRVVCNPKELAQYASDPLIYCRPTTTPDDISTVSKVNGLLTQHGGAYSHAAIVARGMNKVTVVGAPLEITEAGIATATQKAVSGEWITIDGSTGAIYFGKAPLREPGTDDISNTILQIAQETVQGMTERYLLSCIDDLQDVPRGRKHRQATYTIDAECVLRTIVEPGAPASHLSAIKHARSFAREVAHALQKRRHVRPTLEITGEHNAALTKQGIDPWALYGAFLAAYRQATTTQQQPIILPAEGVPAGWIPKGYDVRDRQAYYGAGNVNISLRDPVGGVVRAAREALV